MLIWKKNQPTFSMGRLDYDYQHEPILLTWGKRHKRPMKGKYRTSVWEIDKPRASSEHPTMKPVELVVNALMNNSDRGDRVFDAYSGSGTTLIAAEQLGRRCFAMEISPEYVAVAIERWFEATKGEKGEPVVDKINQDTIRLIDSRTGEVTTVQINRVVGQKVSVSIVAAAAAVVIEREEISFRENNSTSH